MIFVQLVLDWIRIEQEDGRHDMGRPPSLVVVTYRLTIWHMAYVRSQH